MEVGKTHQQISQQKSNYGQERYSGCEFGVCPSDIGFLS